MSSTFTTILSQIKERLLGEVEKITVIKEVLLEVVGISLPKESIVFRKGRVCIQAAPTVKMAITLKKDVIIVRLKERGVVVFSIV